MATSVLVWSVMFLLFSQGHMEATGLVRAGLAMLLVVVGFYAVFRTNLNLRAADPSLTAPQILSSIAVTLYAMYYTSSEARSVLAPAFIMAFFFGVFRLGTRQFAMIAVITMAGYLVLIGALLRNRPGTVELDVELMRCAAISVVLFWFAAVGAYVSRLRKRLALSKTRLEGAVRRVKEQADTDELTGVRNRRYLMDRLNREKSVAKRTGATFCVCIADIDRFKQINDGVGHQVGDTVLRVVAQAGSRWVRVTDYFGRYAGDEFMFILTNSTLDGARQRAEQIRRQIETLESIDLPGNVRATLSLGVARYRPDEDLADTIRRADDALYRAKQAGRNRVMSEEE